MTFRAISVLFLLSCITINGYAAEPKPNFAYPKKVIADAEKAYVSAVGKKDYPEALRALLNYSIAGASISNDSVRNNISLLRKARSKSESKVFTSMVNLILADIINSVYLNEKYIYDAREVSVSPLPSDIYEWSGRQFREQITQLCDSARQNAPELKKVSILDYLDVVETSRKNAVYYPTLYDFAAYQSIKILKGLSPYSNVMPVRLLCPAAVFVISPRYVPSSQTARKILDIYADLLSFHSGDTAPMIAADLARIDFVSDCVYNNQRDKAGEQERKLLFELYEQNRKSEYSGDILLEIFRKHYFNDNKETRWLYDELSSFQRRFLNYNGLSAINDAIKELERPDLQIYCRDVTLPGQSLPIKISGKNAKNATIKIYRLPNLFEQTQSSYYLRSLSALRSVEEVSVRFDNAIPFPIDTVVDMTLKEIGNYIAVIESSSISAKPYRSYSPIHCTELSTGAVMLDKTNVYVFNPYSGVPIEGASVYFQKRKNSNLLLGVTDGDGLVIMDNTEAYGSIYSRKGDDKYSKSHWIYPTSPLEWRNCIYANTDRPIYHPGDTVRWVGISYRYRGSDREVNSGKEIKVSIYGANGMDIHDDSSITDSFGRISGSFIIPKGELTGNYRISFDNGFSTWFMVSDYKLPTFYVESEKELSDTPGKGDVTLRGMVSTYSGMPLSEASVEIILSVRQYGGWFSTNAIKFYSDSVKTSSDGVFRVVIPSEAIENSPAPGGIFIADYLVTSQNGETQQASYSFMLSPSYALIANMPTYINASLPIEMDCSILNGKREKINAPVRFKFISRDGDSSELEFESPIKSVDLSDIKSGTYRVIISSGSNDYPADSVSFDPVYVYRPDDRQSPSRSILWTPCDQDTLTVENDGTVKILVGTVAKPAHILCMVSSNDSLIERSWKEIDAGLHSFKFSIPRGIESARIDMIAAYDYNCETVTVFAERKELRSGIKIISESFRNKLIPGVTETWKFRVVDNNGNGDSAAIILDMYNSALNSLATQPRNFLPAAYTYPVNLMFNGSESAYSSISGPYSPIKYNDIRPPYFNTYGMSLYGGMNGQIFYSRSAGAARMLTKNAMMEMSVEDKDEAAPVSAKIEAATEETDSGNASLASDLENDNFKYRDSSVPLAFFRPTLVTDADGSLSFTFNVPNANATWAFNAIAYNSKLCATSFNASVLANKPIMVQPNVSRFLRIDDDASIESLVLNNSECEQTVSVMMEVFNLSDNKIISRKDTTIIVTPGANKACAIDVKATSDALFMGLRVKAVTDSFSDGEQCVIPVLPNARPVMDTYPFYMAPDSTDYSICLPAGNNNSFTLQYCENPLWYVVTALPGIDNSKIRTSVGAANAIFSAAVAKGLLKSYPQIGDALKEWSRSDHRDSTLVSMLERNSDLKAVLLQATPWMRDAGSDTERMQRLSLLLDDDNISRTINGAVAVLAKLQSGNGGWRWLQESYQESEWATLQVLSLLGYLNEMKFMPENSELSDMIYKALKYFEAQTVAMYKRSPKSDYMPFVLLMDQWPSYRPGAAGESIIRTQILRILSSWEKKDVTEKAIYAECLYRHNYKSVASKILDSVEEFSVYDPHKGLWWPSIGDDFGGTMMQLSATARILMAYHTVRGNVPQVDRIRQWLILQKEARDWSDGFNANYVISAILMTSDSWIEIASGTDITVNGSRLTVPSDDARTGYIRTPLFDNGADKIIVDIVKRGNTPAWGCVYGKSVQAIESTLPHSCQDLSISKQLFVLHGSEWVPATEIKVGDKIRVVLTLKAARDLQYMTITDDRSACMEPAVQTPKPIISEGIYFYLENRDSSTNIFVDNMPKGTYVLTYEMFVNHSGKFVSGIANAQSQYAPQISAHSGGEMLIVKP